MTVEIPRNVSALVLGAFIVLIAFLVDRTRIPQNLSKFPKIPIIYLFSRRDRKAARDLAQKEGIYIEHRDKWIVNVSKAEYAQTILANPLKYPKILPTLEKPSSLITKFLSTNARISNTSKWVKYREATDYVFERSDRAEIAFKSVDSHSASLIEANMSEVDILPSMRGIVQEILCQLVFDQEPDSTIHDLMRYFTDIEQELASRRYLLFPFLEYIPLIGRPGMHERVEDMNSVLSGMIQRKAQSMKHSTHASGQDLISSLLLNTNYDLPFTHVEIRDLIIGFIWAGYESMPSILTAAIYYMAANPAIQQEARAEVVKYPQTQQAPTHNENNYRYLTAIIKETMRMHPIPTTFDTRITKESAQFGNYVVPQNMSITIDTQSLHYDSNIWKDPFDFKPQRFLNSNESNSYEWLGFGGGLRKCPAAEFSMQQMRIVLATLLAKFTITLPDLPHGGGLKLDRDMKPTSLKVTLTVREKS
ncbi:cytochrome P450 [Basidiobolus meristosporus CBS 931.73]|uniref:Cytochrome P450 n=1 Tax=Basidiobolus meristosporus CBS 931.73 TaxID=1314790 RepID=A0A1Y1Z774_9FUNG|nr:cytochrome P450 [Basidiobolus meristosporus CBS 931.73]|eukprot:ORY06101.1 cytochrome P450 [Basidiobolus meristosporus CBS 931.73]